MRTIIGILCFVCIALCPIIYTVVYHHVLKEMDPTAIPTLFSCVLTMVGLGAAGTYAIDKNRFNNIEP